MSDKPETSADLTAELRKLSESAKHRIIAPEEYSKLHLTVYGEPIDVYFAELADRIDAAVKREKEDVERKAFWQGHDVTIDTIKKTIDTIKKLANGEGGAR